jgi:hypothetical protein
MLQLKNNSPFAASIALCPNEQGVETLYILVKATFKIGPQWTLADEQLPPLETDVYWAAPGKSSLKYAADFHLGKPATDIVMLGHACVPEGREATELDVSLSVGAVSKTVRVYGEREWRDGRISPPKPFKSMPLVYEKAFGGIDVIDGKVDSAEVRNPVGCGFSGQRTVAQMNGVMLPNLEDPAKLISDHSDRPAPACFGFLAPNWQPRAGYAGTYDDAWQTQRAPYLPNDFDRRFFSSAHPDLIYPGYLQGGEPVRITHMHPNSDLQFQVPGVRLSTRVNLHRRVESPPFQLETLLLEPNQMQLGMAWKAAVPCDKQALEISEVEISLSR